MKYEKIKQYYKVKEQLTKELGREPYEKEIEISVDFDINDIKNYIIDEIEEKELELKFRIGVSNNNLKQARLDKNLQQKEISKELNIGEATYSQIETCRVYPNKDRQIKISLLLEKPIK